MSSDSKISAQERDLFRSAMAEVNPIEGEQRAQRPAAKPKPIPTQRLKDEAQLRQDMLSDHISDLEAESGEWLEFCRNGVQHATLKRLRKGQYSIQGELDLHGLTTAEAKSALIGFLDRARRQDWRCIRIIHGKGRGSPDQQPILKTRVNQWLRQWDGVLAFCSAPRHDGGTGALYVLLKRGD